MSLYQFFASDKELPEYDNGVITPVKSNKGEVYAFVVSSEMDLQKSIRISHESSLELASRFTNLPYVNYIEWFYSTERTQIIIDYIREALKDRYKVFLFNIWESDRTFPEMKKKPLSCLDVEDINGIWGPKSEGKNACLEVYKEYNREM